MITRLGFIIIILWVAFLFTAAYAYDPLARDIGARPLALGSAYTGLSNDSSGIFTNPAGLAEIKHIDFTSMYTQPQAITTSASLGGAFPNFLMGTIGLAWRSRTVANLQVTSEVTADYIEQDIAFLYAKKIRDNLSLGANVRFISRGLSRDISGFESVYGSGSVLDLGLKFTPRSWLGIGFSALGLGGKMVYRDNNEREISGKSVIGVSVKAGGSGGCFEKIKQDLIFNLDSSKVADEPISCLHMGMEWQPNESLALRLGADQSPDPSAPTQNLSHATAGFGLKVRGMTFDYAFRKLGDAAQTQRHYFSLGYAGPEGIKAERKLEPPPLPTPEAVIQRKEAIKRAHFKDIAENYWAKEEIELLATTKLIFGFPDGTFRPNEKLLHENRFITRAEAAKILGIDQEIKRPNDFITRAEFAVLLSRTYRGRAAIKRLPSPLF